MSFHTLEYLEISQCDKLETMKLSNICGSIYLSVILDNLPSLLTMEWVGCCFRGNQECREWRQYTMMDRKSLETDNESLNDKDSEYRQQRIPSVQESFRDAYLDLERFEYISVLGTLVMNSELGEMYLF